MAFVSASISPIAAQQSRPWTNEKTILTWLRMTYKKSSPYGLSQQEPRLLVMEAYAWSEHLTGSHRMSESGEA